MGGRLPRNGCRSHKRNVRSALPTSRAEDTASANSGDDFIQRHLPPELGLQRSRARGTGTDRIESETLAFFARVRAHYLGLAAWEPARFVVLPASDLDADALCDAAWTALQERLHP